MLEIWLPLLLLAVAAWSWQHVLRLRERAVAHARRLCDERGLQLLDDSVSLHRLRASWRDGGLHVLREYRFATSLGGNDRKEAGITLVAGRVVSASLPGPEAFEPPPPAPRCTPQPPPAGFTCNVVPIARARRTLH